MIDVKLTPSGLWWTAYLCMNGYTACRSSCWLLGVCLDSGSYLRYRFLWSVRVGSDLGCLLMSKTASARFTDVIIKSIVPTGSYEFN